MNFSAITAGLQGIEANRDRLSAIAERIAAGDISADSMVGLKEVELEIAANAAVIRTADRMTGTLLDILA